MCGCDGSRWKDNCNQVAHGTSHLVNQPWGTVMFGCGGSRQKDGCNQVGHLQYCIFAELQFFTNCKFGVGWGIDWVDWGIHGVGWGHLWGGM